MTTTEKLAALRQWLVCKGLDGIVLADGDPHGSEYPADFFKLRSYFSGFHGSAGFLVVTLDQAALWTDSRYFLEAESVLSGTGILLQKMGLPETLTMAQWLAEQLGPSKGQVGLWGQGTTTALWSQLDTGDFKLVLTDDPAQNSWAQRPSLPWEPVVAYDTRLSGRTTAEKIELIAGQLGKNKSSHVLVSALDDIAWLCDLRGSSVAYNPVFYSYMLVDVDGLATLFTNESALDSGVQEQLAEAGIALAAYESVGAVVAQSLAAHGEPPVLEIDKAHISALLTREIGRSLENRPGSRLVTDKLTVATAKAKKHRVQIQVWQEAMAVDGAALLDFAVRLEDQWSQSEAVSEADVEQWIEDARSTQPDWQGPSFPSIVGWKGNGAIVHYRVNPETAARCTGDGLLLVDCGAHYLQGTTDITRVFAKGEPSKAEKEAYTLVLKGHIALSSQVFPRGTNGGQLDVLARSALWNHHMDYGHGTGHGVGQYLCVHEGPQRIATRGSDVVLEPGMVLSNEPGYYRGGEFGIRIENLIVVEEGPENMLHFQTLTTFPYERRLIDMALLSPAEIQWIDGYHRTVLEVLGPRVSGASEKLLKRLCEPLAQ